MASFTVIMKWWLSCCSVAAMGLGLAVGVVAQTTQSPAVTNQDPFYSKSKLLRMDLGKTPDGFFFTENIYRGPDGNKVYFRVVHYRSPDRAGAEFDSRIGTATKVLDREESKREDGGVDEMAVLLVAPHSGDNQKPRTSIVTHVGPDFRTVESDSSEDVLLVARSIKQREDSVRGQR